MAFVPINGKNAVLYKAAKSALTVGDGATPLVVSTWYLIDAIKATASAFDSDLKVRNIFQSKAAAPETPEIGDNCYPLVLTEVCRVDIDFSGSKGSLDTTDSCNDGVNSSISDGFMELTGGIKTFLKVSRTDGIHTTAADFLSRFFPMFTDNGSGTIGKTAQSDDEVIFLIHLDKRNVTAGDENQWIIFSAVLENLDFPKPLKGVQTLDITFKTGSEVLPAIYNRTVV